MAGWAEEINQDSTVRQAEEPQPVTGEQLSQYCFVGGGQEASTAIKQITASDCGDHDDGCCTAM